MLFGQVVFLVSEIRLIVGLNVDDFHASKQPFAMYYRVGQAHNECNNKNRDAGAGFWMSGSGNCIFTASFDDGHPLDTKAADLMAKYGICGTFYVPLSYPGNPLLSEAEIRNLARQFEVGSHSMTHAVLKGLAYTQAREEIAGSKSALEDMLGSKVEAFCYPKGLFDAQAKKLVEEAGYAGARTARWLALTPGNDPFAYHPNVHCFAHNTTVNIAHAIKWRDFGALRKYLMQGLPTDPVKIFEYLINNVLSNGGVLHVWGHSWEIEEQGLWPALENIFRIAADQQSEFRMMTNTEAVRAYKWTTS
jgi:peptidoglycan/xylan/chitin deacetylase (PgdA/CDA1 family)